MYLKAFYCSMASYFGAWWPSGDAME